MDCKFKEIYEEFVRLEKENKELREKEANARILIDGMKDFYLILKDYFEEIEK